MENRGREAAKEFGGEEGKMKTHIPSLKEPGGESGTGISSPKFDRLLVGMPLDEDPESVKAQNVRRQNCSRAVGCNNRVNVQSLADGNTMEKFGSAHAAKINPQFGKFERTAAVG